MSVWFAQKREYDVNIFGIVDKSASNKGVQYNYIHREGAKHGSVQVVSMLHHFLRTRVQLSAVPDHFTYTSTPVRFKTKQNSSGGFHASSCARALRLICLEFYAVGHTKFRPDEGFGSIRQHIDSRVDMFSMCDMQAATKRALRRNTVFCFQWMIFTTGRE